MYSIKLDLIIELEEVLVSHDLPIFQLASAMARHAAARHETVAQNISNADTPGYKARDLTPFDTVLAMTDDGAASGRDSHVMKSASASPNGNTVSIDEQMLMASETKMQHETALAIYRKSMDLLRLGLGKR
jgi:flagellar basal-body rod protein FlgB